MECAIVLTGLWVPTVFDCCSVGCVCEAVFWVDELVELYERITWCSDGCAKTCLLVRNGLAMLAMEFVICITCGTRTK